MRKPLKEYRLKNNRPQKDKSNTNFATSVLNLHEKNLHIFIGELVLLLGGIFLVFHFLYIKRIPQFDLTSSFVLLAVIAITGIFIVLFFSATLIFPFVILTLYTESIYGEKIINSLRKDEKNEGLPLWHLSVFFGVPLLIALLILTGALVHLYFSPTVIINNDTFYIFLVLFSPVSLSGGLVYLLLKAKSRFPELGWGGFLFYQLTLLLSFFMYLMTPAIAFIFYNSKYSTETLDKWDVWTFLRTILLTSIICLIFNLVLLLNSCSDRKRNRNSDVFKQLSFGPILLIIMLVLNQSIFSIPQLILSLYGMADVENVKINFSEEGCETLKQFDVRYLKKGDGKNCSVNHAKLISAIGSESVIETIDGKEIAFPSDTLRITKLPRTQIELKLNQTIDENNNLKKLDFNVTNHGSKINKLTIVLFYFNEDGKLLDRTFLKRDISLEKNAASNLGIIEVPLNLKNNPNIWCDVEVLVDGNPHWYKFVEDNNYE